jgi:hypothetical protein
MIEADSQAEPGHHGTGPLVQVRTAQREPPLQPAGVVIVRARCAGRQRVRGRLHLLVRRRHAGPPGQELPDALTRVALPLLRQITDRRIRRADGHRTGIRRGHAREHPQQRRLTSTIRADQADDIAGTDHQIETGEQHTVTVPGRQALGHKRGTHRDPIPAGPPDDRGYPGNYPAWSPFRRAPDAVPSTCL